MRERVNTPGQQWLLQPDRVPMVKEFGAYVAVLRARWGTAPVLAQ